MTSPSYSRGNSTQQREQVCEIQSVDLVNLKAVGASRNSTNLPIDLRYYVGAAHVIPAPGDQWVVRWFGTSWILDFQLPFNTTELATVAANPVKGLTQIGSTNPNGLGPLELNGSEIHVNANYRVGTTLYRDNDGTLEYQLAGSSTWVPVAAGGSVVVNPDWDDIVDKPDEFPTDWDHVDSKPTIFDTDWSHVASKPSTFPPTPPTGTPDGTKFWRDDDTWAVPPGSGGGGSSAGINIVTGETPGGSIDGTNVVFSTASVYESGSTMVYLNGIRLELGLDYTETTGHTLTFGVAPVSADNLRVDYVIPGLILSFMAGEVPSGTKNGTNVTFTMSHNYLSSTTQVFRNGLREQLSVGYTEAGTNVITFSTAPLSTDILAVDYLAMS